MLPANATRFRSLRSISQLPDETLADAPKELARHWLAKCRNAVAPSRDDFDPIEMAPQLLPFIILWDVADGDFRCRLAGTEVCNAAGRELKGLSLVEMHGDDSREVWQDFTTVASGDSYSFVVRSMAWAKKDYALYQRLLLPLSIGGHGARYLVGAFSFPRRSALTWTQWHVEDQAPA